MAHALQLQTSPVAWHSDRSAIVNFAQTVAMMTGTLGKFGQDAALMAQQGIDEVRLARGGTSSAMPHKSNPVQAELLVTLAQFKASQAGAMHLAMIHEQERSGAAWMLEWLVLPQMTVAGALALKTATALCKSIDSLGR